MNKNLIITAISELGIEEIKGEINNPRIIQYFHEIEKNWVQDDETAWCSAFINYCAKKCGLEYSNKLNARSWLNVGEKSNDHEIGDVVVFWRESPKSWKGHVGLFFGYNKTGTHINVLGGNQNNKVCFKEYPVNRLIGFRRLK